MKNIYKVLVVIVSLICSLVSCQNQEMAPYESVIVEVSNSQEGTTADSGFSWGKSYVKDQMPQATCEVNGKMLKGEYSGSRMYLGNSYTTDTYKTTEGYTFSLREDTRQLVKVDFMNRSFFDTEPFLPDVEHIEEKAVDMANKIAASYVSNIDDYVQTVTESQPLYKERDGVSYVLGTYIVTFTKKISEYDTQDFIWVSISSKGHVMAINMGDIGAFDHVGLSIDHERLTTSIEATIQSKFGEDAVGKIDIPKMVIVKAPTGEYGVYSDVSLQPNRGFPSSVSTFTKLEVTK